jgi:hypothetical protein
MLERAFQRGTKASAEGLASVGAAMAERSDAKVQEALEKLRDASRCSAELVGTFEEAQRIVRWTFRGRRAAAKVAAWEERCMRGMPLLCAAALLLGQGDKPPAGMAGWLAGLSQTCRELPCPPEAAPAFEPIPAAAVSNEWQACVQLARLVAQSIETCGPHPKAGGPTQ